MYHFIVHSMLLNSTSQLFAHENKDLNVFSRELISLYRPGTNTLATAHAHLDAVFTITLSNLLLLLDLYKLSFPVATFFSSKNFLSTEAVFLMCMRLNHLYIKIKLTEITVAKTFCFIRDYGFNG